MPSATTQTCDPQLATRDLHLHLHLHLHLPHDTLAVSAVHNTTAEYIYLFVNDLPDQTHQRLREVVKRLRTAGPPAAPGR